VRDVVDESTPTAQHNLRLLALAAIYDGAARTKAANIRGFGFQIIRNWVLRLAFAAAVLSGGTRRQPNGSIDPNPERLPTPRSLVALDCSTREGDRAPCSQPC
jgi:hypothetical protein